jgi:membrane-associated protease RseP (regulator of RpoE activity)
MNARRMLTPTATLAMLGLAALPALAQEPHPPAPPPAPPPAVVPTSEARGWLGFAYHIASIHVEANLPGSMRTSSQIIVAEVLKDSPADKAGLEPGDTLDQINGQAASFAALRGVVEHLRPGDTVHLKVRREGHTHDFTLKAGKRPDYLSWSAFGEPFGVTINGDSIRHTMRIFMDSARMAMDSMNLPHMIQKHDSVIIMRWSNGNRTDTIIMPRMSRMHMDSMRALIQHFPEGELNLRVGPGPGMPGFTFETVARRAIAGAELQELNDQLAQYFGVREGLLVVRVATGTPSARAGLEAGDVITAADGRSVGDLADLRRALRGREGTVKLEVMRKGKTHSLELKWP